MNQNGGIHKGGFAVLCHRNGGSESPGILKFPMESAAVAAFQPPDQESSLHSALQTHDPDTGIPIGKRFPTDRAVGYGAALNKKYHFHDCK